MKVTARFSRNFPIVVPIILMIGLLCTATSVSPQASSGDSAKASAAERLDQASNADRQDATALRARADQWKEMQQKAEDRSAKATDPVTKSVWKETALRHAEEAAHLEQQAAELEHRAADESAQAAQERAKAAPAPQPPAIATVTGTTGGTASSPASPPSPAVAGAQPKAEPSSSSSANSAAPDTETNAAANPAPTSTPAAVSEADIGGCACPELPALDPDKPPVPGHVHDELSEADLEAMFSNRDQIYSGWATSLDALARDIDPRGSLKIWSGPAPRIVNPDIALKEGGESGVWVGRPLPPANSYVGNRAELMARNPHSWGQTPEYLVGPLVATLARTRKYGSPQYGSGQYGYSFRNDLLTISLFLGETLANGELPGTPLDVNRPSIVPSPAAPAKSPEEVKLEQEAVALRKQADVARTRAKGRDALLQGAKAKLAEVKDRVNREVWTEIVKRYQEELDRANKEVKDLEDAASEKEAQAATSRPPPPIPPPGADDLRRFWQAKAFGARFKWGVINGVLRQVTPASLRLTRSRPHAPNSDPLTFGASGRKDPDELPLDRFDAANAALDMILWHDSVAKMDTGWLTFNDVQEVETRTLLELAAAGPKFAAAGTVVSPQQAAIACKAFSTLVYLADSDAKSGEDFQRAILKASSLFSYASPENTAQADYSQVPLAGRAAIMETGIASPALAQTMAHIFLIEARSSTRDSQNNVVPRLKEAHDFAIETARMLASGSGGASHKGFRNEFYDAIQKQIPVLEANRANGTGSPEDTDLINKWNGGSPVVVVRMGPTGKVCQALCADCARAIEAEKPNNLEYLSKPKIVVSSKIHPQSGESIDSLYREEPFSVELMVPKDKAAGLTSPTIHLSALETGQSTDLKLKRRSSNSLAIFYSNSPETASFSEGGQGGGSPYLWPLPIRWGRGDMGKLRTENGDVVEFSYPDATPVRVNAYTDNIQQSIARSSKDLLALGILYDAILQDPDSANQVVGANGKTRGQYLRMKLKAIANFRAIMDSKVPATKDFWFTELAKARIAIAYLDFVRSDANTWDYSPGSSSTSHAGLSGGFPNVEFTCALENEIVRIAMDNTKEEQQQKAFHAVAGLSVDLYRISLEAACLGGVCPETYWILITGTNALGEPVNRNGQILNGLGLALPLFKHLTPALKRLKSFAKSQFLVKEGEVLAREATVIESAAVKAGEMRRSAAIAADAEKGAIEYIEGTVAGQKVKVPIDQNLSMRGAGLSATPLFEGRVKREWAKGVRYPAQIRDDTCVLTVAEGMRRSSGLPARTEAQNILLSYERGFGKNILNPECYAPGNGTSRQAFATLLEGDGFKVSLPNTVNLRDIERALIKGEYVSIFVNNTSKPLRQMIQEGIKVAPAHAVWLQEIHHFADGRLLVEYYDPWNGMFGTVDACTFSEEMFPGTATIVDPIVRRP
jgi:hypothetical protein